MRLTAGLLLALLAAFALWFWWSGSLAALAWHAAQQQHEAQTTLARAITRVRGGEVLASFAVLASCFAYGVLHAAGPGHGKAVMGSAALASRASAVRLSSLAMAASLGQAVTAIVLVYGGFLLFEFSARAASDAADKLLAPLSYAVIGTVGIYLVARGTLRLWQQGRPVPPQDHHHHHDDHPHGHVHDEHCGHAHGPSLEQVTALDGWRATIALVAGIAIRPCTGAIFVLAICWQAGLPLLGILGAIAMAVGTGLFTVMVALAALAARNSSLTAAANSRALVWVMPVLQVLAGSAVLVLAAVMLLSGRLTG